MIMKINAEEYKRLLPGVWHIQATNFPMWLSGKRKAPSITYGLLSSSPLVLSDLVEYTNKRGKAKSIKGNDTFKRNEFEWRGQGLLKLLSSRWRVLHIQPGLLLIQFEKSLFTPAGIDILADENMGTEWKDELLASPDSFGISRDQLQGLCWL